MSLSIVERLRSGGCVFAEDEAELLLSCPGELEEKLARREAGEPLAWITGSALFLGHCVRIHAGVYVPRPQSEPLVERAIALLPADGLAADLCTGSGALAVALQRARPGARVVATDLDPRACACARDNGVEVYQGSLDEPLPADLRGRYDVVVSVVPYVPTEELVHLACDARDQEPIAALDGGPGGTRWLEALVWRGAELLKPGGTLLLELGGAQDRELTLTRAGFALVQRLVDEEGDLRGIEALKSCISPRT